MAQLKYWDGSAWVDAVVGLQGTAGPQGVQGNTGAQGLIGIQGPQGTQGTQGVQGPQGTQGVQGNLGIQGTQGVQGPQGTQGVQGLQGLQGGGFNQLQGTQGPQGPAGGTFNNTTSTTSHSISTGSKTFTVASTGGYALGERVRVANTATPTNYVEGQITGIVANTSITVDVTLIAGSGTFTAWTFSVTGDRGIQGPSGGPQGTQGTIGPSSTSWNFITTLTPAANAGTATANITTYNRYMIFIGGPNCNGSSILSLRFNGDTGANYNFFGGGQVTAGQASLNQTSLRLGTAQTYYGSIEIEGGNTSGIKSVTSNIAGDTSGRYDLYAGYWAGTASITSITFVSANQTFAGAGSFYIYGSN